jgi:hypothetical protein
MSIKKQKFYNLNEFFKIFNKFNKNICLISHINNYNILEADQIKFYCDSNNIKTKYIKIGLLKKLTKNSLLINLLAGPTQLFFFKDIHTFYKFFELDVLRKCIYPLSIYFNNTFFNYIYFSNYINEKISSLLKYEFQIYNNFLFKITNIGNNLIIKLKTIIDNFIFFLRLILHKFKILKW